MTAMYDGSKGAASRRGHIIREGDIPLLLDYGERTVFVWEENAGEIHEEDAARRMAAMAPVKGAYDTEPSEGKVLLIAEEIGMSRVDRLLQRKLDPIGDITIASLPDHSPQIFAGDELTKEELIYLGRGGLCRLCSACHWPNCTFGRS